MIDKNIKDYALNVLQPLIQANCEIRGDDYICSLHKDFILASEQDWSTAYLDKILSVKLVGLLVRGVVLGISTTAVTPPHAAAAEPVAQTSFSGLPGSLK